MVRDVSTKMGPYVGIFGTLCAGWEISDHQYRISIIGGSRSGKKNSLFNLISHHLDISKIYSYPRSICRKILIAILQKRK